MDGATATGVLSYPGIEEHDMNRVFVVAAAVLVSGTAFAQSDLQLRPRQLPGWDSRAREGRCEIRVWVDNRAEVRLRGDTVFVRTLEGAKARDEGSECTQPLPYNSVRDFQVRQTAGRTSVAITQEPSRMNNYTSTITINDTQGGGDNYAFEATWRADADVAVAPAPFFDDVRACQETVRQRSLSQNGRGSYVDFTGFPDRQSQGQNRGQESIQGRGVVRTRNESRDITYSCLVDTQRNQVASGTYQFSGDRVRMNDRPGDRPLR